MKICWPSCRNCSSLVRECRAARRRISARRRRQSSRRALRPASIRVPPRHSPKIPAIGRPLHRPATTPGAQLHRQSSPWPLTARCLPSRVVRPIHAPIAGHRSLFADCWCFLRACGFETTRISTGPPIDMTTTASAPHRCSVALWGPINSPCVNLCGPLSHGSSPLPCAL